jgi:hypothetical protein
MKDYLNLVLFIILCFAVYFLFKKLNYNPMLMIEGMTNPSKLKSIEGSSGIANKAAAYAASLKSNTIQLQDKFLISKYRSDYESAIINLDDYIDNLMLNAALSVNHLNPTESIDKLAKMQQAKLALNSVMKFLDSQ